jgi:hypothetical protein
MSKTEVGKLQTASRGEGRKAGFAAGHDAGSKLGFDFGTATARHDAAKSVKHALQHGEAKGVKKGFAAGAASRDAEVTGLHTQIRDERVEHARTRGELSQAQKNLAAANKTISTKDAAARRLLNYQQNKHKAEVGKLSTDLQNERAAHAQTVLQGKQRAKNKLAAGKRIGMRRGLRSGRIQGVAGTLGVVGAGVGLKKLWDRRKAKQAEAGERRQGPEKIPTRVRGQLSQPGHYREYGRDRMVGDRRQARAANEAWIPDYDEYGY